MNNPSSSNGKKARKPAPSAMTVEETIAQLNVMEPNADVLMRREMEQIFPSISAAMKREVSEGQIIAALRQKWPGAHVATLIKLLNAERARRLAKDEPIECKPFGSPRKPKKAKIATSAESVDTASRGEGEVKP